MKELSTRLNEEVANATKAAKRDTAKLQLKVSRQQPYITLHSRHGDCYLYTQIQEVENQLADETKARTDAQRALKK